MEENTSGILHAIELTEDGGARVLDGLTIGKSLEGERPTWLHLDGNDPASRKFVESTFGYLDPILVNALFADETRPRILEYQSGTLLILRGINLNADAEPEDMISVRLWVEKSRIVSIRRRPLKAIADIRERLEAGKGPGNTGEIVSMLTARLFERMEPVFSGLDERLDDIEEKIIEEPDSEDRQEISNIRKQAILFRRYIAPQREVIAHLRSSEQLWLDALQKRRLQESLDHVMRYVEDLDTIRERAQIVKDEIGNALSDKMNKNLYLLSIIAAIFLPLGFLTGLLGINLGGIPGADSGYAFAIFCAVLALVVVLQVFVFRKMKLF